ncbi:MAG: alpha/beta hydrolase, partial [bacterium]|nr:alpha/beta hydrolase [bacterium]
MKIIFLILFTALMLDPFGITYAETTDVEYPYPVSYLDITIESVPVRIAYMDVKPAAANGRTVMLLHGKNFNGYYWKDVITSLSDSGFRVVVPDQAGWGKSGYPDIHYSFHLMSWTMKKLLDTLGVDKTDIIAHSMGGMLGTRFTLIYPATVNKLILENPIG